MADVMEHLFQDNMLLKIVQKYKNMAQMILLEVEVDLQ